MRLLKTLAHIFHPQRSNNHRPKILHPKPLLLLAVVAVMFYEMVGFAATYNYPSGSILGYASNITTDQIIAVTNTARSKESLTTLTSNDRLAQAAQAKAENMFAENYWAHTSPSGKEPWDFIKAAGYSYKVAGENLARDFDTAQPVLDAWMNSPTHRANILNPRYSEIGIAVVNGRLDGVETTLVVQMFGTQSTVQANPPSVVVPVVTATAAAVQVAEVVPSQPIIEEEFSEVLSRSSVIQGELSRGILFSPQHLLKAFFLSILVLLVSVLIYDGLIVGHKNTVRLVGKNLAHILLFLAVGYLILAFKGGVVGP